MTEAQLFGWPADNIKRVKCTIALVKNKINFHSTADSFKADSRFPEMSLLNVKALLYFTLMLIS